MLQLLFYTQVAVQRIVVLLRGTSVTAHMSEAGLEYKYVKEAFDTNWVVPMGPNVNAFEKDLEAFANSKVDGLEPLDRKVVCLSAGTAVVHLIIRNHLI